VHARLISRGHQTKANAAHSAEKAADTAREARGHQSELGLAGSQRNGQAHKTAGDQAGR
jgi:hypothetical protein